MTIGFYGTYPESWHLTPEQKRALAAMEDRLIEAAATIDLSCASDTLDDD